MIEDSELEDIAATAKKIYSTGMRMSQFIKLMDKQHWNTPPYVYRIMFIAISTFDMV